MQNNNRTASHAFFKAALQQDVAPPKRKSSSKRSAESLSRASSSATLKRAVSTKSLPLHGQATQEIESLNAQMQDLRVQLEKAEEEIVRMQAAKMRAEEQAARLRESVGTPLVFGTVEKSVMPLPTALEREDALVRQFASGAHHIVIVLENGVILVWGRGNEGQLGLGDNKSREKPIRLPNFKPAKFVAAGGNHTFAVTTKNVVYAWGENNHGQLGIGSQKKALTPTLVTGLPPRPVVSIQTSRTHTLFLTDDGEVFATGKTTKQDEFEPLLVIQLAHYAIKQVIGQTKTHHVLAEGDLGEVESLAKMATKLNQLDADVTNYATVRDEFLQRMQKEFEVLIEDADDLWEEIKAADARVSFAAADGLMIATKDVRKRAQNGITQSDSQAASRLLDELEKVRKEFDDFRDEVMRPPSPPSDDISDATAVSGETGSAQGHDAAAAAAAAMSTSGAPPLRSVQSMGSLASGIGSTKAGSAVIGRKGSMVGSDVSQPVRRMSLGAASAASGGTAASGLVNPSASELRELNDITADIYAVMEALDRASIKEINKKQPAKKALLPNSLVSQSNARLAELALDISDRCSGLSTSQEDPIAVMLELLLDSIESKKRANDLSRAIVVEAMGAMRRKTQHVE